MAAYVVSVFGIPRIADIDDTITRCPASWSRKISIAASVWASAATKFVIAVSLLASNRPVPSGAPLPRPALTTTRSRLPKSSRNARNTSKTASWSLTSSARISTRH